MGYHKIWNAQIWSVPLKQFWLIHMETQTFSSTTESSSVPFSGTLSPPQQITTDLIFYHHEFIC